MTQEQERLATVIKYVEIIEKARLVQCPEDYPPSEWTQYKRITNDIKDARVKLSEIYMLM